MANELELRQDGIGGLVEDNPLSSSATTLTSAALAAMAAITSTSFMWGIIDPDGIDGAPEHVKFTLHTAGATTATILRGQNGTTARSHVSGTQWIHGPLAVDFSGQQLLHVRDEKASGVAGPAWTSGAWTVRDLNTILVNEIAATLATNVLTLLAGTYEVDAHAPMYRGNSNQARLYNVTDAAVVLYGTNEWAGVSGNDSQSSSKIKGRFTITATKNVQVEHRTSGSGGSAGIAHSFGGNEIYTEVLIRRMA